MLESHESADSCDEAASTALTHRGRSGTPVSFPLPAHLPAWDGKSTLSRSP